MEDDHTWYSSYAAKFNPGDTVVVDWCVRCGEPAGNVKPRIMIDGQSKEVDDVETPEGLL